MTGQLLGDRLTFLVHSPARAGLAVGHTLTVDAVWEDSGYSVDELQWFRRGEMMLLLPDVRDGALGHPGGC